MVIKNVQPTIVCGDNPSTVDSMKTKGILKTEYTTLHKWNSETSLLEKDKGDTTAAFQWHRLSENQYLVILPRIFKKETGDTFVIVSAKRFLRLLNNK